MGEIVKRLFCLHINWSKYKPGLGEISKAPDWRTNTSYWYCCDCGKEFAKPYDFIPVEFIA